MTNYKARHGAPSTLAKFAARGGVVAAAAAIAASGAGAFGTPADAATTPLQVSFGTQVAGDGSSAGFNPSGDPVLTLGSGASTTGAYMTLTNAPSDVPSPSSEPTFTTNNYTAGSPRYYITLSNGKSLVGYPSQQTDGVDSNGMSWGVGNGAPYTDWAAALNSAGVDSSTTVTGVQIIADGDQASGTTDTLTNVTYDGMTVGGGTVSLPSLANQHATEGTGFSVADPATTTSSDPALAYTASGLPGGLSIDPSTGTISGTPAASGQFAVTVHAKDVYGDGSAYQHFVLDIHPAAPAVTYTVTGNGTAGQVKNVHSGKFLNVASGSYATGNKLIQWDNSGKSHEKFQVFTVTGSDGSKTGFLEAEGPGGNYLVTASGEGELTLGAQAPTLSGATSAAFATSLQKGGSNAGADMLKSGSYYTFPNDSGYVMDVSGQSTANGAKVIAYKKNNGTNQQWSLP